MLRRSSLATAKLWNGATSSQHLLAHHYYLQRLAGLPLLSFSRNKRNPILLAAFHRRDYSSNYCSGTTDNFGSERSCCGWQSTRRRGLGTKAQKRALRDQQKKDGTLDQPKEEPFVLPKELPPAPPARPPSMVRTDFADPKLILPSGYEIPSMEDGESVNYVDYKDLYDPQVHLPSAPQDWTDYEPATPLWDELAAQIGVLGRPMTVAEFMQHALLHPQHGYYSQPTRQSSEKQNDDDDLFSDSDEEEEANNNPIFGPRGDFVTAPEICQVFGESIQVWMVTQWEAMNKPRAMQWVEFGPGRGTLMADMVQFALTTHQDRHDDNKLKEYGNALQVIHFIEPSHPLRDQQQASLQEQLGHLVDWKFHNAQAEAADNTDGTTTQESEDTKAAEATAKSKPTIQVHWHDSFGALSAMIVRRKQKNRGHAEVDEKEDDIANMPLFVICQEFFDALPVHAFEMTKEGWRERMVDMAIRDELLEDDDDDSETSSKPSKPSSNNPLDQKKRPRLRIVLAPEVTPALKTLLHVDEQGNLLSEAPNTNVQTEEGQVVEVCPEGILLVQDIASLLQEQGGAALIVDYGEEGSTDSLRGFWKHKQVNFLSLPGQTDVTADVDFTALKHAINYARPQRLAMRNQQDASSSSEEQQRVNIRAYGPIPQGKFLVAMGARERVIQCIESDATSEEEAEELFYALQRLVAEDQMGIRYKVLAIAAERKDRGGSFTVAPAGF